MREAAPSPEERTSRKARAAWARRRPPWTRNETVRWLNARSAGVLAVLRRLDASQAPRHSDSMGRWLQSQRPDLFRRAHERLAQPGRDRSTREKIDVLRALL